MTFLSEGSKNFKNWLITNSLNESSTKNIYTSVFDAIHLESTLRQKHVSSVGMSIMGTNVRWFRKVSLLRI